MKRLFSYLFGKPLSLSKILAFIVTAIIIGIFNELGKELYVLAKKEVGAYATKLGQGVSRFLFYKFEINVILLILLMVLAVPIYLFLYKRIFSRLIRNEKVLFEDFNPAKYNWNLNYWGDQSTVDTVQIIRGSLLIQSEHDRWKVSGENGAYFDLQNSVVVGQHYEITCKVIASPECTMGYKLWVHDTQGNNSKLSSLEFQTPSSNKITEYKVLFVPTKFPGIRIHLHCKEGNGFIKVDQVKVRKL